MEQTKRSVGRPRKTEEEKRERKLEYNREYWKRWTQNMTEEQRERRRAQSRKSHDKWVKDHKEEWNAYMREYNKRKKAKLDKAN